MRTRSQPLACVAFLCIAAAACSAPAARASWMPNGVQLCVEPHYQLRPTIVADGAGGAIVAWTDGRLDAGDIYAQRVDSSGVLLWNANGVALCTVNGTQGFPVAVPGDGGGATVFWEDHRDNRNDIYAQRIDGSGLTQWASSGLAIATSPVVERQPLAIADGSAGIASPPGWIALFIYQIDGNTQALSMQHVDASGAGLWASPDVGGVRVAQVTDVRMISPALATDGVGSPVASKGAVVAWSQVATGSTNFDLYARRINAAGVPQWPDGGVPVCALLGNQNSPDVANVGSGNVVIAWEDSRIGDQDIYAQKLNSSGVAQWIANGHPVCRVSGTQSKPRIISDGAGGVIAVWEDYRVFPSWIYAQRLDANGQRLWGAEGIALRPAGSYQYEPVIVADGAGGAIVAWRVVNGTQGDLYAQRMDANGNLLWSTDGVPLCSDPGDQEFVAIVPDGRAGIIAAWQDHRSPISDIYANRATAGGGIVDVPAASPQRLRLAFVSANPTRGEVRMRLELPGAAWVRAEVLDALGRRVRALLAGADLGAGAHPITWDGADASGAPVAPGLYFVRLRAGQATLVTRVVELR